MAPVLILLLLGIGPILALIIGSLGVALIEETIWGWPLFLAGACYPPGAVILYRRFRAGNRP